MIKLKSKPFVKWAGGKSQLLDEIRKKYPNQIIKYCEPFVGGGAVLFDVLENYHPKEVLINDINVELINTYRQVKYNLTELIIRLDKMQTEYLSVSNEIRRKIYNDSREKFNSICLGISDDTDCKKAALFIFLNKTCFNGLYRVNRKGQFNVPIGSYKNPMICDTDNLTRISLLMQNVSIRCGDYKECLEYIDENTFVYIDPPYRPLTSTASFTAYDSTVFGDDEQIELRDFIDMISNRGAKVVASNSDPKNANMNDCFFDLLYQKYFIQRVTAKRMINSKGNSRGSISELLISNY